MRLIDADELDERFERSCTTECAICPYSDNNCGLVHEADTVNAIVIPKGATNGDVIEAMFPNINQNPNPFIECYDFYVNGVTVMKTDKEWWNAPYKAESEDNECR